MSADSAARSGPGEFPHPVAFWCGVVACAVPLLVGIVLFAWAGPETRRRRLGDITRAEFDIAPEYEVSPGRA